MIKHSTKIGLVVALFMTIAGATKAQQEPMFTQYMFNTLAINPGYAGSKDVFNIMALSRHQWTGFKGAPSSQTLTLNTPLPNEELGAGFSLMNDKIGPVSQLGMFADIAYRLRLNSRERLAFGLKGGVNFYQANVADLVVIEQNDDAFASNVKGELLPNFGFGMYYFSEEFYLGVSTPRMLKNKLNFNSGVETNGFSSEEQHYYIMGGYTFEMSDDVKMKPAVLVKVVSGAPSSTDINLSFLIKEKIWAGANLRLKDSFGITLQYYFNNKLKAGYAYDFTTTNVGKYNSGTHEIMMSYDLKPPKGKDISGDSSNDSSTEEEEQ